MKPDLEMLSVVIPARDEEGSVASTVKELHGLMLSNSIPHEILVVDDGSTDGTSCVLRELAASVPALRPLRNDGPNGFGRAIVYGLNRIEGDAVVIMMADASDSAEDVLRYWERLNDGYECVFGSRFIKGARVIDYPKLKLLLNRMANLFIRVIFQHGLNDTTNAFKAYRREVIDGIRPILSPHFNITVELPLKAIIRGYSWTTIPVSWRNRKSGESKLRIKEMGSRYLFICIYVWMEKFFSRGDYHRTGDGAPASLD